MSETGFAHSAVSPILHWILNYNSLRQSACQPFAKLSSAQRFLRSHLRFTGPPQAPPSSTNEAALGPFNPRFIKQRPQVHKPPASSHYLYWASAICKWFGDILAKKLVKSFFWKRWLWDFLNVLFCLFALLQIIQLHWIKLVITREMKKIFKF